MSGLARGGWLAIPILAAALIYVRFFNGYWLGDDFGNLHTGWVAAQQHTVLANAWAQLFAAVPSEGAFYRPAMILSVLANAAIAGAHFGGWFIVNYALHLANIVLVGRLVASLAQACGRDGAGTGVAAAGIFALSPVLAEGVFWVSARADCAVTLLTFAGFLAWTRAGTRAGRAFVLPLGMLVALGFKESAAVLPLQVALVAFAWPSRPSRAQLAAVIACFAVAGLFFVVRANLFADVWHVYRTTASASSIDRLRQALASVGPWWHALARPTPRLADGYAALLAAATTTLMLATRGAQRTLAAALLVASAGLVAATLVNLGGLGAAGEGGRLAYTPFAWLALAIGVAAAPPIRADGARASRVAGLALAALAALAGVPVLEGELVAARDAQRDVEALAAAMQPWAASHPGLTLLVIDERRGPVVTGRNAQGALVLPPIAGEPLLHRILPTLPAELETRHAQFEGGLASRLAALRPSHVDADVLKELAGRDAARWPDHYACWSSRERRIVEMPPPDPAERTRWVGAIHAALARCDAAP